MTPLLDSLKLAGLLEGSAAPGPVPPLERTQAALLALNHRGFTPEAVPDGALRAALITPDYFGIDAGGQWQDGAGLLAGGPPGGAGQALSHTVRAFGPMALVHGLWQTADGRRWRFTDAHHWSGRAWRLVSAQDTPLAAGVDAALQCGDPAATADRIAPPELRRLEPDQKGDEAAVLTALNEHYVRAFREADVAWYAEHLAPDYCATQGDGAFTDRAAALQRFARPVFATQMATFPVGQVRARRFGDLALIHAENDYTLKDGRRGISRYTDIWHHRSGRWCCISAHITGYRAPA